MILTVSPSGASSFPWFVIISSRAHRQALLLHTVFLFLTLAIAPAANSKPFSVYPTVLQLPIPSAMPSAAALSSLTSHRSCEKIPGPILKLQWWRRSSRSGLEANSRASAPFLETSLYSSGSYCQMADGKAIRRRRATAWPWIYNAIDCLPGPKL